jgi:hypothetical protein
MFITNGVHADLYCVAAKTGGSGSKAVTMFLVEKGTPGFCVGRRSSPRRSDRSAGFVLAIDGRSGIPLWCIGNFAGIAGFVSQSPSGSRRPGWLLSALSCYVVASFARSTTCPRSSE